MKKILGLTALALFGLISFAQAGPLVAQHWMWEQAKFRTHISSPTTAQLQLANSGYDAMGFYVDSLTIMNNGASALDTTIAFSTTGWAAATGGLSADTALVAQLGVVDAGSTTATSATDSIYVYPQVSFDGRAWICVAIVPTVLPNTAVPGAIAGGATPNGIGILTQNASATVGKAWFTKFYGQGLGSTRVIASIFDLARFPFVRFIIQTDASGAATYNLKATLGHWSASEDLNTSR